MPVAICGKCRFPVPDSFHDHDEVCECIDWRARAKEKGWELRFPKEKILEAYASEKLIFVKGKHLTWEIKNKKDELLGMLTKLHWGRWTWNQDPEMIMSRGCMKEVMKFWETLGGKE